MPSQVPELELVYIFLLSPFRVAFFDGGPILKLTTISPIFQSLLLHTSQRWLRHRQDFTQKEQTIGMEVPDSGPRVTIDHTIGSRVLSIIP